MVQSVKHHQTNKSKLPWQGKSKVCFFPTFADFAVMMEKNPSQSCCCSDGDGFDASYGILKTHPKISSDHKPPVTFHPGWFS